MSALRLLSVRLDYGRHRREFVLPQGDTPVVITGANGAGKSTLLEGIVRTLFGYNRRGGEGRELEWRQPWDGGPARGRVELLDASGERVIVERDLTTNDVTLTSSGGATESWRGDGNPAGTNSSACDWRQRLVSLVGFERLDHYERTAFVRQGELLATRVDESLLRAAAGSPIDVERALIAIEQDHRRLTRDPVSAGRARAQRPREREELAARLHSVEAALATARERELARAPAFEEERRLSAQLAEQREGIERLEAAQLLVVRRDALSAESERLEERIASTERRAAELERAGFELAQARSRFEGWTGGAELPADFAERAAALEQLWPAHERALVRVSSARTALEALPLPSRVFLWASFVVTAAAGIGVAAATGAAAWAGAGLGAGTLFALVLLIRQRNLAMRREAHSRALNDAIREADEAEGRIARQLEGLEGAKELSLETLASHRAAHQRRQEELAAWTRADERYRARLSHVATAVGDSNATQEELAQRLQEQLIRDRNERAEKQLRLAQIAGASAALPAETAADLAEIQRTLGALRAQRADTERQHRAATERLAELRPAHNVPALEAELTELRARLEEIDESAAATRLAFELLDEANQGFRQDDQRRLLERISGQLLRLSDGALGPLRAAGDLDTTRLAAFERDVPLDHPPLSYGQLHLVMLAVRLGAADFIAHWGQIVPLILDEPFASLDEDNAAAVWEQLGRVARERQVIIATQETHLLERLGARPAIDLGGRRARPSAWLTRHAGA